MYTYLGLEVAVLCVPCMVPCPSMIIYLDDEVCILQARSIATFPWNWWLLDDAACRLAVGINYSGSHYRALETPGMLRFSGCSARIPIGISVNV